MNGAITIAFGQGTDTWFKVACFFFILLCVTMFLLHMRIKEVQKWKDIAKEFNRKNWGKKK